MRNFFRALERCRVRYLLISGQATVLYGASTFSEDVDIWVAPTVTNWKRLLQALTRSRARIYKLTPPLTLANAKTGHGFHFIIPASSRRDSPGYLDVMAVVPRCRSFASCHRRARNFQTAWGCLPVLHPFDLVQIKRTRRLADYDVISALARLEFSRQSSRGVWRWALDNTFDTEDRLRLWDAAPPAWRKQASPRFTSHAIAAEIEHFRQQDRTYWKPIIADLKHLQHQDQLLPEGALINTALHSRSHARPF